MVLKQGGVSRIFRHNVSKPLCSVAVALSCMVGGLSVLAPAPVEAANNPASVSVADSSASKNARAIQGQIVIDAPPSHVWQTITQYHRMAEFLPGYKQSQVAGRRSDGKILKLAVSVGHFLPTYRYNVVVSENKKEYHLRVKRISGDLNHLTADYRLYPRGNGSQTLLVQKMTIDPGTSVVGMNHVLKNHTEKSLAAIGTQALNVHRRSQIGRKF